MDAINLDILKQLQEYAKKYFAAIVELNTVNGKCNLAPGKYLAKQLIDNSHKSVFGHYYALPEGEEYDETITVESGTFRASFPYRRIFTILADWETMCRAGKLKTLFEIGEDEVKSAKVLTQEKTVLGAFKTKSMKLQHIGGNWWGLPKEIHKGNAITGYYELNGVMFAPGKTFWGDVASAGNQEFCKNRDDADIIKLIKSYIEQHCSENPYCEYITEVARLAGISNKPDQPATPTETPQISTEAAETVNVSAEGEKEAETKEMPRYECPNYADYAFERGWSIENTDFDAHSGVLCMIHFDPTDERYVCGCLWQINSDSPNYTEHRRFKTLKGAQNYGTKRMGMKLEYQTLTVHYPTTPIDPTQSSETPQTVECTADTPKPREMARKRQNRAAGCAQRARRSGLGANGYSMLDYASAMLAAMNVPRKCSTELSPPGYVPPIRGDCTTYKRPTNDHITDLKPP